MIDFPSVHLQDFPGELPLQYDVELVEQMDKVRDICSTALAVRDKQNLRVRLPLAKILIVGKEVHKLQAYQQIIADELNVKEVIFNDDLEHYAQEVLKINFRQIGERLGSKIPQLMQAVKNHQYQLSSDKQEVTIMGETLQNTEFTLELVALHSQTAVATHNNDMLIELDTQVTPELEQEGIARDIVRLIQQSRKEAKLEVSDRIYLSISVEQAKTQAAILANQRYIQEQTLAVTCHIEIGKLVEQPGMYNYKYEDENIYILVTKSVESNK